MDKIKVGEVNYKIVEQSEINNGDSIGYITHHDATIRIDQDVDEQVKPMVLVHEVLHAILHAAGFQEHSESYVSALSYGLVQVLRENPEFIQYVTKSRNVEMPAVFTKRL